MSLQRETSKCRICASETQRIGQMQVFRRHPVELRECIECGFRQSEEPWWLEEAYRDPINRFDTGVLDRVLWSGKVVKCLVALAFDRRGRFVDFGGGYGLFVRHMRDQGLDFLWEDRFCANLLARGFEATGRESNIELVTAFEVVEHAVEPAIIFRELLGRANALLFSTQIAPDSPEEFLKWHYLGSEHGQHVSFFRLKTLKWIAKSQGVHLISNGVNLHLLSHRPVPIWKFLCADHPQVAWLTQMILRWPSLTIPDHEAMKRIANGSGQ